MPDRALQPASGLQESARREVLWCGRDQPIGLIQAAAGRGWRVRTVPMGVDALGDYAPAARALIIEVPSDVSAPTSWAKSTVLAALDYGLAVVLAMAEEPGEDSLEIDPERVTRFVRSTEELVALGTRRIRRSLSQWGKDAEWIADSCQVGPAPGAALRLDGDVPDDADTLMLLRRAFHDFSRLTLKKLQGGKSGAGVWVASPGTEDVARHPLPFLVKYNTLAKTRVEQSRYALYASDRISFRLRPSLHTSRCVEGSTHGLLVFDFIERAQAFRTALSASTPSVLIASLFGHTLSGCLRVSEVCDSLSAPFERIKVLNWSAGLHAAAARAQERRPDLPDAESLRARITSLPPVRHRVATAHGDLHTGNLLVAAGSSDVLLIDFGSIESRMPVATDPACLEVSIVFPVYDVDEPAPFVQKPAAIDWLREAYRFPLEVTVVRDRDGDDSWLANAVRAIRSTHQQLETDPVVYAVAVASYLIRYASYPDNGTDDDRSVAYELACDLVRDASAHLCARQAIATTDLQRGERPRSEGA